MRANPNLGVMRQFRRDTFEAIARGNDLSMVALSELLERVAMDPADRSSSLALVGAHIASPGVRGDQILWFIEHEPFTSLGMYAVNLDAQEGQHERAVVLWVRAVERWHDDLRVLENAAWFFASTDPPRAVEIVESRLREAPADADAWELASVVFDLLAAVDSTNARAWWVRSIDCAFRSFTEDHEPERRIELLLAVREAVSRVHLVDVLQMLDLASAAYLAGRSLSSSPRSQAILVALGFISLAAGKNDRAMRYLADALLISVTSEAVSLLAESLAKRGERAAVCEQLNLATDALSRSTQFLAECLARIEGASDDA